MSTLSPLDSRYASDTADLCRIYSEDGLIKTRCQFELLYLNALQEFGILEGSEEFDVTAFKIDPVRVREIEQTTRHDVKAVEYYLQELLPEDVHWAIHFGLTSEDINSSSHMLMLKDFLEGLYASQFRLLLVALQELKDKTNVPMMARTHGQPAVTTTMAKEIMVYIDRLLVLDNDHMKLPFYSKFGGAVGTLAGHYAVFPDKDWQDFASRFMEGLGLSRLVYTTQINNYDNLSSHLNYLRQVNTVLIDMCQDLWQYISLGYFKQSLKPGEVGSSTMPQKVNPINFENAEGNLGLCNSILEFMSRKLPISRMQRDLSDSTVLRNIGVALGYQLVAFKNIQRGLNKLELVPERLKADLDANWAICTEHIQLVLRKHRIPRAYELCKEFSRGQEINRESLLKWVQSLDIPAAAKAELMSVDPANYLGFLSS